jgi:hypothetical protein
LVVAGTRAQFKGIGTINGVGEYGFMLTGIDGDLQPGDEPDRFRIKIRDRVADQIVYDNQIGETDDSDAATAIGGGSIVIHKTDSDSVAEQSAGLVVTTASALPTRAGAEILFTLSARADVSVDVLNIAGRPVRRVVASQAGSEGRNSVVWDACAENGLRVPGGMYIVRITARSAEGAQSQAITPLRIDR